MEEDNKEDLIEKSLIQKDIRDIKRSFTLEKSYRRTWVAIIATSEWDSSNRTILIPCNGMPITREVYDSVRDGFVVDAVDYFEVGSIPVSYKIFSEDCDWSYEVPLPMAIIRRYMSEKQKSDFAVWKAKHKKDCSFYTV